MVHKLSSKMDQLLQFHLLIIASLLVHVTSEIPEAYVVYMGSAGTEGAPNPADMEAEQLQMLSSIIPRHYFFDSNFYLSSAILRN
ncbi:hypothetical protein M5K25_019781 [Dendrobium thyrsiflorum]|uniref:Uncharacterized protein n=1 Tax=Dendrobium thyrsiflorum TaxID=117978 RepID=A0ABD0UFT4_DENTH